MTETHYEPARTGLLLVDPYNDFLAEGGKVWPLVAELAAEVGLLQNTASATDEDVAPHPGGRGEAADESSCKPDPVPAACAAGDGHPSGPAVAGRLERSTRRLGRAALERLRRPANRPFLTLHRVGFT